MIDYKKTDKKAELLKLCEKNGIKANEDMSKEEIISELDKFNAAFEIKPSDNSMVDSEETEKVIGEKEQTVEKIENMEGYDRFAYVGPSIPETTLREGAIFRGSLVDIQEYLSDIIKKYPATQKLIVPVGKLAEYTNKVKKAGNVYNLYYQNVISAVKGNKEV